MPGDLQQMLETLASTVGRSISLDDTHGELLGYSIQDAGTDGPRVSAILSRRTSPEIQRWQNRHGIRSATAPVRIPPNAELAMAGRLCVPIRTPAARLLGHLWVLEDGAPLSEDDLATASRAASDIAELLDADSHLHDSDGMRGIDRRLSEVLHLQAGSAADILTAAPQLREHPAWILVAWHPPRPDCGVADPPVLAEILRTLRASRGHVAGYQTGETAVALFTGPAAPADTELAESLRDLLTRADGGRSAAVGVSDPGAFGADFARSAHSQAVTAARVIAADPALPSYSRWHSLGLYRALLDDETSALDPLVNRGGSALPLLHTLETYLDLAGDAQATSEALALHRTTLYYRLNRIAEILHVDLGDGMTRTHLHTELKRRRLTAATSPGHRW